MDPTYAVAASGGSASGGLAAAVISWVTQRRKDYSRCALQAISQRQELYKSFIEEHRPQLRFHYKAIAHLLDQILIEEASWDAFFEHSGIRPVLILYENFEADYETSTLRLLERLDLSPPEGFAFEPRMKRQSDGLNDDWTKRYSELRLGTEFDLVPAVPDPTGQ